MISAKYTLPLSLSALKSNVKRPQEQPEEFHESLRQIPMRWRSSLSSIMTSMASNGGFDEQGAANGGGGEGGTGSGGGAVDMDVGDGKSAGSGGERKVTKPSTAVPTRQPFILRVNHMWLDFAVFFLW